MFKTDAQLKAAFAADRYDVVEPFTLFQGKRGITAKHRTARITGTGAPKKAYYVEGSPYQMGYLIGYMAEREVRDMALKYVENVIPAFIAVEVTDERRKAIFDILLTIVKEYCHFIYAKYPNDIPATLQDELRGMVDGCKAKDSTSTVTFNDLLSLNAGVDCLVAAIYTGLGLFGKLEGTLVEAAGCLPLLSKLGAIIPALKKIAPEMKPEFFRVPIACNAFSAFGGATNDGNHYFGRDFQFPAAGVFQDAACLVVYNPEYQLENGDPALPLVSMTAPGFAGSVTAMSSAGVAIGVDMAPSANCDPTRPGLNSLLLVRHAAHHGSSAEKSIAAMVAAQRGASWMYPVGDGTNNRAAVVEAGVKTANLDYLSYPPDHLKPLLPTGGFQPAQQGLIVRWNDYQYPTQYLAYNQKLFEHMNIPWDPAKFGERAHFNQSWHEGDVILGFFFAPQRETKPDLLVVTNHNVVPEMRLCAMRAWTNIVASSKMCDILWRYDELNKQCLDAYGSIDEAKALELIDFLSPKRKFPAYYGSNQVIEGSVSLCNLTTRKITSHFGYQPDEWVDISLPLYVG